MFFAEIRNIRTERHHQDVETYVKVRAKLHLIARFCNTGCLTATIGIVRKGLPVSRRGV